MTKKLKILGPYTPEHEGPFCTRDGRPVDLRIRDGRRDYPLVGYVDDDATISEWTASGNYRNDMKTEIDLMNAEEVPQPREFWIVEYISGRKEAFDDQDTVRIEEKAKAYLRTIHVREVLPGEGE